jgi:hypothetical protein
MSAPDNFYVVHNADTFVAVANGPMPGVETYHHDRVVDALRNERDDLRRRLDKVVEFLRSPNWEDPHMTKYATDRIKSAIEAAKGGA